jgi:LAO/AO transport system kinase
MWLPPIHKTVATTGTGIAELADSIAQHVDHLHQSGEWHQRDRARLQTELELELQDTLLNLFFETTNPASYQAIIEQVIQRSLSPRQAVQKLLEGNSKDR